MSISFQDSSQCVPCWSSPSRTSGQAQLLPLQAECAPKTRPHKISLKKHPVSKDKVLRSHLNSTEQFVTLRTQNSQNVERQERRKDLFLKLAPLTDNQTGEGGEKRDRFISQNYLRRDEENRGAVTERVLRRENFPCELDRTMKIASPQKAQGETLEKTRKFIPVSHTSLYQLSKMKNSVISILGPEEKPRVEESVILIDFFKPTSHITEVSEGDGPR